MPLLLTKLVPLESSRSQFLNGTKIVENDEVLGRFMVIFGLICQSTPYRTPESHVQTKRNVRSIFFVSWYVNVFLSIVVHRFKKLAEIFEDWIFAKIGLNQNMPVL